MKVALHGIQQTSNIAGLEILISLTSPSREDALSETFDVGRIRYSLTSLVLAALLVASACSPPAPQPRANPEPGIHSERFASLQGNDTLSFEVVTTCFGRVIADVDHLASKTHLHYEFEFDASGYPRNLNLGIWSGGDLATGRPTQIVRTIVRPDSIITDVWRMPNHQVQRFAVAPQTFPWTSGYVGLLGHLIQLLASKADVNAGIRMFFIATGGHTATAYLVRQTADSVFIRIDSTSVRSRLSNRGFGGATFGNSGFRIVQIPLNGNVDGMNSRCGGAPFISDPAHPD